MKLSEIAHRLGIQIDVSRDADIFRVSDLRLSQKGDISFLTKSAYRDALSSCQASAVLMREGDAVGFAGVALVVKDPYLAYAKVAQWLDSTPQQLPGIHPSAVLAAGARIASDACIGPHVVIEDGVVIESGAQIGAGCYIGMGSVIGAYTRLWPNVSIYHNVRIGKRCLIHSGTVIGSDGFGFASEQKAWVKIPQTGGVLIGDDVEMGAGCTIDRGALNDTIIENGVKFDNLIHIAHNVVIGAHSAMAAMTGIAGGTRVGKHVTLAGRVSVAGHLSICDYAHVTICSTVVQSITEPGAYSSGTLAQPNREWRKSVARFFQLDDLFRRVRALERQADLSDDNEHE